MTRLCDLETIEMADDVRQQPQSALGAWYSSIRERDIKDLGDDDLCRVCRQGLFHEVIVPITLARLAEDPLAGDMYEGEMLASLVDVPRKYWTVSEESRRTLRQVLASLRGQLPSDMAADLAKLQALIAQP